MVSEIQRKHPWLAAPPARFLAAGVSDNHAAFLQRLEFYDGNGCDFIAERDFIYRQCLPLSGVLVEIGTGKGHFSLTLARNGHRFSSVDVNAVDQSIARMNLAYYGCDHRADFILADAERLPFPTGSIDVVVSVNVIHHLEHPRAVAQELIRVLKDHGKIILSDFTDRGMEMVNRCHSLEGKSHDSFHRQMGEVRRFLDAGGFTEKTICSAQQEVMVASRGWCYWNKHAILKNMNGPETPPGFWTLKAKIGLAAALLVVLLAAIGLWRSFRGDDSAVEFEGYDSSQIVVTTGTFARGGTLAAVMDGVSVKRDEQAVLTRELSRILNLRRLRADDHYRIIQSTGGEVLEFIVTQGVKDFIVSLSTTGAYMAQSRPVDLTVKEKTAAGTLSDSLWNSMVTQGVDPDVIAAFADVFAWEIDFNVDPRAGDRFALLWEDHLTPTGRIVERRIRAASYEGRQTGKQVGIHFEGDYYDTKGEAHRRAFLKAPLAFRRITSRFSRRRFHPILRYFRPHLAIDYAAPTGTPVVSVGDGTVIYRGRKGAYGNYIEVRHNSSYTTCYGHLSRYAKGLQRGSKVRQGQVIGYVGSTGWSTGPHLDFRVRKNGSYVNFMTLKLPPEKNVPLARKDAFMKQSSHYVKRLSEIERGTR
ncbi:MAG TPA: peptidoglycan DD-metalloendopeptidase family protein [Elusimicrobiota bacterium]|nr:peptidoglycan DD-metalloendopeptidase family protein [Elusimicrobiota bacterium]